MREIKFRAWNKENEKMNDVFGLRFVGDVGYFVYLDDGQDAAIEYDQEEVIIMQYTGLKDKKGEEICEGDIVHIKWEENDPNSEFYLVVEWNEGSYYANESRGSFLDEPIDKQYASDLLVIGNIYENPELLK